MKFISCIDYRLSLAGCNPPMPQKSKSLSVPAERSPKGSTDTPRPTLLPQANWTFLSNHTHVLLCIRQTPDARARDIAEAVGITERAVQRIIAELADGGFIKVQKLGRRNEYKLIPGQKLRHPLENHCSVEGLLKFLAGR
jgi:predicted transcriptional regulator